MVRVFESPRGGAAAAEGWKMEGLFSCAKGAVSGVEGVGIGSVVRQVQNPPHHTHKYVILILLYPQNWLPIIKSIYFHLIFANFEGFLITFAYTNSCIKSF